MMINPAAACGCRYTAGPVRGWEVARQAQRDKEAEPDGRYRCRAAGNRGPAFLFMFQGALRITITRLS